MQVEASLRVAALRAAGAAGRAIHAASCAVGAAGGGWALLAALQAAAAELTGVSLLGQSKCTKSLEVPSSSPVLDGPVPEHIAVIMDGNRRFGRREYGDSLSGHRAGGEKLRDFVCWCVEAGVKALTVFAFSTENWKREPREVEAMLALFLDEVPRLGEHATRLNVRVRFLTSDEGPIPPELKAACQRLEERSSRHTGLLLNVCLSYGGRGDVAAACRRVAHEVAQGQLNPEDVDEQLVSSRLLTGDLSDPDVLIRTSGERRLSNFLMFQLAYTELFFLEKHWPEVTKADLLDVIGRYQARHRRYGQ